MEQARVWFQEKREVGSSRDWIDISSNEQGCGDAGPDIGWSPEVAMAWAPRHPCRRACTIDEGEKGSRGSGCCMGGRSVSCGPRTGSWPHAVRTGAEKGRCKMVIGWREWVQLRPMGQSQTALGSEVEQGRSRAIIRRMMSSVVGG